MGGRGRFLNFPDPPPASKRKLYISRGKCVKSELNDVVTACNWTMLFGFIFFEQQGFIDFLNGRFANCTLASGINE
jgi:hypothetical protein